VKPGEWPAYARDPGGMRHSPLTQVNRDNVGQLELAWTYRTGELGTYGGTTLGSKAAFEATPLMVDGVLYLSTPTNRVIALDAATGVSRWVYDPTLDLTLKVPARPWATTSWRSRCHAGGSKSRRPDRRCVMMLPSGLVVGSS
jgi:glucose dehydrogenase